MKFRYFWGYFVFIFQLQASLACDPISKLVVSLEYDQEIKGLFIPKSYFTDLPDDLFVGSAKIYPEPSRLYSIGWKPAVVLDSVRFSGSTREFVQLTRNLARKSKTSFYFNRVQTRDRKEDFSFTISGDGSITGGI